MRGIEWALGIAFSLVAVFLILNNYKGADSILKSLAGFGAVTFGTLQGRPVTGQDFAIGQAQGVQ